MRARVSVGLVCALLMTPAWAQQEEQRSTSPSRAQPNPTSNPPDDPHRAGGRPESHGGTMHVPKAGAAQSGSANLAPEMRDAAEALARTSLTAQQYGNLASKRHASGAAHDLGDKMALTNSRIQRSLSAAVPGLQGGGHMPATERGSLDTLARDADETQFSVSVAQWVAQSYPQAINALERLQSVEGLREMTNAAIPEMRAQLSEAQRILQSAVAGGGEPSSTGSIPDPRKQTD